MTLPQLKEILKNILSVKETSDKGFHITMKSGYNVSVQWKESNYCHPDGSTAEVAVWDKDGKWEQLEEWEDVSGWQDTNGVLEIMHRYCNE